MSLVKFVRGTVLGTGVVAQIDEEVEMDRKEAEYFVNSGRAVFVDGDTPSPDPGIITTQDTPKPRDKRTR